VPATDVTKEKAERWTRWMAFAQVRHGSNIQLLLFSLVTGWSEKWLASCRMVLGVVVPRWASAC
jgi:hypothetical protein